MVTLMRLNEANSSTAGMIDLYQAFEGRNKYVLLGISPDGRGPHDGETFLCIGRGSAWSVGEAFRPLCIENLLRTGTAGNTRQFTLRLEELTFAEFLALPELDPPLDPTAKDYTGHHDNFFKKNFDLADNPNRSGI